MRRMGVALQMYTLRSETAADFRGTLRQVAGIGFEGVEFAGYGGISADEMKELLLELGLKVAGSHVGLDRLRTDLQGEIDYLKEIGGKTIICPYSSPEDRDSEEGWKEIIAELKAYGEEVSKHGLAFAYHNHGFEFTHKVGSSSVFDALFEAAPPEQLQAELDVCWVKSGGEDPLAYIRKYAGRLPLIHLKDLGFEADKPVTLELGQGIIPLMEVIEAASDAGVEWLVVEQDDCWNPPLQSVTNSFNWVKRHYLRHLE